MIQPPQGWGNGLGGAAFSSQADGDLRADLERRESFSAALSVATSWASISQVHGAQVVEATSAGDHGEADGLWTSRPDLPIAVFTADCVGLVLMAEHAVGVVHAGWRGLQAGIIERTVEAMTVSGFPLLSAAIGPSIGPCCFEVGSEVADAFVDHVAETTWGTMSVDLPAASRQALGDGVDIWGTDTCTRCNPLWFSHRRNATLDRMVSLGWRDSS